MCECECINIHQLFGKFETIFEYKFSNSMNINVQEGNREWGGGGAEDKARNFERENMKVMR